MCISRIFMNRQVLDPRKLFDFILCVSLKLSLIFPIFIVKDASVSLVWQMWETPIIQLVHWTCIFPTQFVAANSTVSSSNHNGGARAVVTRSCLLNGRKGKGPMRHPPNSIGGQRSFFWPSRSCMTFTKKTKQLAPHLSRVNQRQKINLKYTLPKDHYHRTSALFCTRVHLPLS